MSFDRKYLDHVTRLVSQTGHTVPFWVEDLLLNGPRFELWNREGLPPNRVLITEMLLRWSKSVGLTAEQSLEWLMPFNLEVLALTSRSGPSMIRHGTKANTRWVYKSKLDFEFEPFIREIPEAAFQNVPPYMPIFSRWWDLVCEAKQKARDAYVPPVFEPVLPVKKRFKEQYEKALAYAREKEAEGLAVTEIARLLNEQGLPTSTGRRWTSGNLDHALHHPKFDWKPVATPEAPPAAPPASNPAS